MSRIIRLNKLVANKEEIVFYPYRKAEVRGLIEINAESEDEIRDYKNFQEVLCKMTTKVYSDGKLVEPNRVITPDNHTCFMVGSKTAIMFSDWEIRIGTEMVVRNW